MTSIDPEGAETQALRELVDFKNRSVLEIGAGDGRLTRRIAPEAESVLALDSLERDVLRAREAMSPELEDRVEFLVADATTFRYPRNRFDIVVLSHSL